MLTDKRKTIGNTHIAILEAAYALAKAQSADSASDVLRALPSDIYAELARHMHARPNLFLPEVRAAVAKAIEAPNPTEAEALFS